MRLTPLVCPLVVVACVGEAPTDRPRPSYIRNGSDDTGDPAVVSLVNQGRSFCTGTLVTENVVVTAAHCVAALDPEQVFFGFECCSSGRLVAVTEHRSHPGYDAQLPTSDFDIAVMALAEPVTDVAPIPLNDRDLTGDWVGHGVRMIGFGNTEAGNGSGGRKRQGSSTISEYDGNGITYQDDPSGLCFGDSGGPTFISIGGADTLLGVHWKVGGGDRNTGTCQPPNFDTRVDAYLDFVQPFIDQHGGGGQTPDPGDPDPQPDPDPDPDPGPGGGDCGGVSEEGRCSGDVLEYCFYGTLQQIDCSVFGLECAWAEQAGWYDCVSPQGGGGASCDYPCDLFGLTEGQCLGPWQCRSGCLEDTGCN